MNQFVKKQVIDTTSKGEKIYKGIIKAIGTILFCLVATFVLSLLFGYQYLTILTGSMEPNLPVGTIICIHKVDFEDLKVGDVVTYGSKETVFVTHRIIEIGDGYVVTQGDASNNPDPTPVSKDRIQGKVIFHSNFLGDLVAFFKDPFKILILIVGVGLTYYVVQML